jgi:acyl carrier protein
MSLKEEIIGILCKTLEVEKEELRVGEKLYDSIGIDSTEIVELITSFNKHFGIKIETNELTKFSTPEDIVKIIEDKKQHA